MNVGDQSCRELLRLTGNFFVAVKDSDKETAERIAGNKMKIEYQTLDGGFVQDFDKDNLDKIPLIINPSEISPHIHFRQHEARLVYERYSHLHLPKSDFQNGFVRQTYLYKKSENDWKLNRLKTETRRFSRYDLKSSALGFLECMHLKTLKIKWIIKR